MSDAPRLRVIDSDATPEEVAAIVAAVGAVMAAQQPPPPVEEEDPQRVDAWVRTTRMVNRRAGMTRGPWRMSGRLPRRSRV